LLTCRSTQNARRRGPLSCHNLHSRHGSGYVA
jgi:hypothetical protein